MSIIHDFADIARRMNQNKPKPKPKTDDCAKSVSSIKDLPRSSILICCRNCHAGIPRETPEYVWNGLTYITCQACGTANTV